MALGFAVGWPISAKGIGPHATSFDTFGRFSSLWVATTMLCSTVRPWPLIAIPKKKKPDLIYSNFVAIANSAVLMLAVAEIPDKQCRRKLDFLELWIK